MTQKVLLITNIPTPYRIPLFNVLHHELAERGIDFTVIFGALGYARRKWSIDMDDCAFPYEVLPTTYLRAKDPERAIFTYKSLFRVLKRERPAVVITNGFSIATTKLWLRSFVYPTPYIIWSGAIRSPGSPEPWWRRWQRKMLVQRAKGFVAYGSRARDYLLELGACVDNISIGINTVDTEYFRTKTQRLSKRILNKEKNDTKRLLFVGHLIPRKGADQLLRIVQCLANERQDFVLDIVGSGSEQPKLEQLARDLGIEKYISFKEFRQNRNIPRYMAKANCFVFPTRHDIWGLVLVEAMAAGMVCVSSIYAGATCDLIEDGENGFVVDFSNLSGVAEKLYWLLDHPEECERIGQRAKNFIEQQVTLKQSSKGFLSSIERILVEK